MSVSRDRREPARIALWGALLAGWVLASATAAADPLTWDLELESGAEYDSNIHRCETDPDGQPFDPDCRVGGAPLARTVLSVHSRWRPTRNQRVLFDGLVGSKLYGPSTTGTGADENVVLSSGDLRYERALGGRGSLVAARATGYDSASVGSGPFAIEPRHFRLAGADAEVSIFGPEQHRVLLSAGYRRFRYKADDRLDWHGDRYGVHFQTARWRGDPDADLDAASIDLSLSYELERRYYEFFAAGNRRSDLFHELSARAAYTGDRIYSALYQLQVTDSNTYGFSFVRQRLRLGLTTELIARWYFTVEATLQLDLFLDAVRISQDVLETIDDENRSSLSAHVSRALSSRFTAELRYAVYLNELSDAQQRYRRHIAYAGLVYHYAP